MYFKTQVMCVISSDSGIQAFTVFQWENELFYQSSKGAYKKECQNVTTAKGFSSCIKNKTFGFNDLVVSATRGDYGTENEKDLSDFNLWIWDMTSPAVGRCYTLDYDVPVGINQKKDILAKDLI